MDQWKRWEVSVLLSSGWVYMEDCGASKKMLDLSYLTRLESLQLRRIALMEEVGGLSPALKEVCIEDCGALKKMPDLSSLTCLERLQLHRNGSMEEVGGLSPALKVVRIVECGALKKMPDVSGLTCLERLILIGNESMEEVGGEHLSSSLKELKVRGCRGSLRCFPSLNECIHLELLSASPCIIDEVSLNTEKLANLHRLQLIDCEWTSKTEQLISGLTHLRELAVVKCEINVLKLDVEWRSKTEYVISGLTHLQKLATVKCDNLLKVDVVYLPISIEIRILWVIECRALEEIGDLSALHSLRRLFVCDCPNLQCIGGLPAELRSLWMEDCGSLEESSVPHVSVIPSVYIEGCGKLDSMLSARYKLSDFSHGLDPHDPFYQEF